MKKGIKAKVVKFLTEHPNVTFVVFACALLGMHSALML